MSATVQRVARRLGGDDDAGAAELDEVRRAVERTSARIEATIARERVAPDQLTPATRGLRGWLGWMAQPGSVDAYRAAVARVRAALAGKLAGPAAALHVEFRPISQIYRLRTRPDRRELLLPTPMVRFDDAAALDLAELIAGRGRTAKQRVVQRMRDEAYVDLMTELEALGGVVERTRGAFHDLGVAFDRVNAAYFAGDMPRPRLTWSASMTSRKMGHYDHVRDTVMVSSTLDHAAVPGFVVDYLMFHELLHKKHGIRWQNGRGYAHTAAFCADEQRFARYDEADRWLTRLARA